MKEKKKSLRPAAPKARKGSARKKDGPRGEGASSGETPAPPKTIDPPRGGRR